MRTPRPSARPTLHTLVVIMCTLWAAVGHELSLMLRLRNNKIFLRGERESMLASRSRPTTCSTRAFQPSFFTRVNHSLQSLSICLTKYGMTVLHNGQYHLGQTNTKRVHQQLMCQLGCDVGSCRVYGRTCCAFDSMSLLHLEISYGSVSLPSDRPALRPVPVLFDFCPSCKERTIPIASCLRLGNPNVLWPRARHCFCYYGRRNRSGSGVGFATGFSCLEALKPREVAH